MTHTKSHFAKVNLSTHMRDLLSLLSICIVLGLLIWALDHYQPSPTFYGPRAIFSLLFLSIALALLGRVILIRMLGSELAQA